MYKYPNVADVAYYVVKHKRKDRPIAHDPKDPDSTSRKSQFKLVLINNCLFWRINKLNKYHILKYIHEVHKKIWMEIVKYRQQITKNKFLFMKYLIL